MATKQKKRGHLRPIHSVFDITSGIYTLYIKIKTIHLATCLMSYTIPVIIILVFDIHIYRYSYKTLLFKIIRVEREKRGLTEIQVSRRRRSAAETKCFLFVMLEIKNKKIRKIKTVKRNQIKTKKKVFCLVEFKPKFPDLHSLRCVVLLPQMVRLSADERKNKTWKC